VCQVRAFVGKLMQYSVCDELNGKLNVAQSGTKPNTGTRTHNANIKTLHILKIQQKVSSFVMFIDTIQCYYNIKL
jgi:hypothetical protein